MTRDLSPRKKVVLITGAAGGLGQEMARQFLAQDWRVAAQYHHSVLHQSDPNLLQIPGDITQACQVNQMIQSVLHHWRALDVLVNNAGIAINDPCWQVDDLSWDQQLSVNLKGAFFCCRAAAVPMANQGGGHIINIASFAGRQGSRGQSAYAAAKAGLLGLSASLARELGPDQVQVNAVLPGVLPTPMTARLSQDQRSALVKENALQRLNSLDEAARFIVFLATMKNVSGQVFQLDSRISPWT